VLELRVRLAHGLRGLSGVTQPLPQRFGISAAFSQAALEPDRECVLQSTLAEMKNAGTTLSWRLPWKGEERGMFKVSPHPYCIPVDAAPLLPVRRLPEGSNPYSPLAARHLVPCPMVGTEVVLQRCSFCAYGSDWIHDQATDTNHLRCSYLAREL